MRKIAVWTLGVIGFAILVFYMKSSQVELCAETAISTKAALAELATCSQDSECTSISLSCPFDCKTPVRRDRVFEAMAAVSKYQKDCMMICPDCPKVIPGVTSCHQGRCRWEPAIAE